MRMSVSQVELNRLAETRATGVLHVGTEGSIFLTDGLVTFAESERATDLGRLLTASGRVSEQNWQRARTQGAHPATWQAATGDRAAHAEFETPVLLALFDAAFFLLTSPEPTAFVEAQRHWLDPIWRIAPGALTHEITRRQTQLEAVWPYSVADDVPVVPVRRLRRQRVILTGLQAELLLNADGRRTVAELARELGHTCFGSLLALRGLAAAALVRVPSPTGRPQVTRAIAPGETVDRPSETIGRPEEVGDRPPEKTVRPAETTDRPSEAGGGPRWAAAELDLLVRLRDALTEAV